MNLKDFFKLYLPNYRDAYMDARARLPQQMPTSPRVLEDAILVKMLDKFPEAIQNFADQICEKQRKSCIDSATDWYYKSNCGDSGSMVYNIENAEQPKIDEL
jgi:hypothetical protein